MVRFKPSILIFLIFFSISFGFDFKTEIRRHIPFWLYTYLKKRECFIDLDYFLKPDLIIIYKRKRKLALYKNRILVGKYYISLGRNPDGKKEREWDGKTPEGFYYIDWRNEKSDFYLSLKISYPNFEDKLNAYEKGYKPGSLIMIHGFPNWTFLYPDYREFLKYTDWTNGCIAVSNKEVREIWDRVDDFTPVIIKP
ncbi:MAG: hypothetical protein D6831_00220 [Aquificota bacterium]|nr:MAG: hypothetical protein D6831_00220 [Aquificota bacterium]